MAAGWWSTGNIKGLFASETLSIPNVRGQMSCGHCGNEMMRGVILCVLMV